MSIRFSCDCGQPLRVGDDAAGSRFKCPRCGEMAQVPAADAGGGAQPAGPHAQPEAQKPRQAGGATVHLTYPGQFFWFDVAVDVLLDGQSVGKGFLKKGVDLSLPTTVGSHTLELVFFNKRTLFSLDLPVPGTYEARVRYTKMRGGFSDKLDLVPPAGPSGPVPLPAAAVGQQVGPQASPAMGFFPCVLADVDTAGPDGLLWAAGATKSLRSAIVRFQDGTMTISAEDATGGSHPILSVPTEQVAPVQERPWRRAGYVGSLVGKTLMVGVALGAVIAFMVGREGGTRGGMLGVVIAASLGFGVVLASLFVLIPGLIRARKKLVCLLFRIGQDQALAALVRPEELPRARQVLASFGVRVESQRAE